jgi:hypothetical protein
VEINQTLTGEIGILMHAIADVRDGKKIFLLVNYVNNSYVGVLQFDEIAFCARISEILKKHTSRSICFFRFTGDYHGAWIIAIFNAPGYQSVFHYLVISTRFRRMSADSSVSRFAIARHLC